MAQVITVISPMLQMGKLRLVEVRATHLRSSSSADVHTQAVGHQALEHNRSTVPKLGARWWFQVPPNNPVPLPEPLSCGIADTFDPAFSSTPTFVRAVRQSLVLLLYFQGPTHLWSTQHSA